MATEILPGFYRLDIPLPNNPLKSLNSYVIKGEERNLIIDTGMNREECLGAINVGLADLEVDLKITDFFITHMHADHSGLLSSLATPTSKIYCSAADAFIINAGGGLWEEMQVFMQTGGFPEGEFHAAIRNHPGYKYRSLGETAFTLMKEKDTINAGDYLFSCVETPGHTPGHLCLYEEEKKFFVSGDHILSDITPNISLWSYRVNPLADYLNSLEKVYYYDIDLVLPGHRRVFHNHRQRIDELKVHHRTRADEVLAILAEKGWQNAYQVASYMTWDIAYRSFADFPIAQKWFATGEALAHLKYLEEKKMVRRYLEGDIFIFSAVK